MKCLGKQNSVDLMCETVLLLVYKCLTENLKLRKFDLVGNHHRSNKCPLSNVLHHKWQY